MMKKLFLFLVVLIVPVLSRAQSEHKADLDKQQEKYQDYLKQQTISSHSQKEDLENARENVRLKRDKFAQLEKYEENFAQARMLALADVNEKIKTLPFFKKVGAKVSFYKCLRTSLEKGHLTYDICQRSHLPKLSEEEISTGKVWKETVGVSLQDANAQISRLPKEIEQAEEKAISSELQYKKSIEYEEQLRMNIKVIESQKAELKLIPKFAHINNCDENSPEVNLEEEVPFEGAKFKGAFSGIPRDNQDGLGTCYANAAKNLLVGLSGGEDVASFLDLALHYKDNNNSLLSSGLDGGDSCGALEAVRNIGYCPQKFSPMEMGEKNQVGESLFNVDSQEYLATNVTLLKKFVNNLKDFEISTSQINKDVLSKAKSVIEFLKSNPDIELPLPIVKNDIPQRWKLLESYHIHKKKIGLSQGKFLAAYNEQYKKFYPHYVKAILEQKSLDEVFEIYKREMNPFFKKYDLEESYPQFKRSFEISAGKDFKDPKLQKKLQVSLDYLKELMNKKDLTDDSFIKFCSESGFESLGFLGSLGPLVEKMRQDKLNDDQLFDKDGKIKSPKDLMQLTVAPSCINEENRKKLPAFKCMKGYDTISKFKLSDKPYEEKVKMLRERVVLSLAQGYPVGNSFPTNGGFHINTIVGLRFNKANGKCEYRIRESQNGTSTWQDETPIFDKMMAITEVRKE